MKTLKIIFRCIAFVILTLLISCEKFEDKPKSCNLVWSQTFGDSDYDKVESVQQTTDGGYILAGWTTSYGAGNYDAWLIKTNAEGNEQWSRTFGDSDYDVAESVQQTTDGGYILAGWTNSYGAGSHDAWLIKTDATGIEQWSQTFGSSNEEMVKSVQQTTDGGYILAGWINSYEDYNAWLIKTNAEGNEQWSRTFGGSNWDKVKSVQQTMDGGYILAGYTDSYGTGNYDAWLIKTNVDGVEQWSQTFGGSNWDEIKSVQQTMDGGYILAGYTNSYGAGNYDFWLIKTNPKGIEQWSQTFGDTNHNMAESVQQTTDGNYILAGWTNLYGNNYDGWLIKVER